MACRDGGLAVDDLGFPELVVLVKGRFAFRWPLSWDAGGVDGDRSKCVGLGGGCGVRGGLECRDGLLRNSLRNTRIPRCRYLSVEGLSVAELLCGRRLTRCMMATKCRLALRTELMVGVGMRG